MLDSKFKDREFLARYDLDLKLFNNYDFTISDVVPIRKVFILVTNKGNKVLKRIEYNISQLDFLNSAIKHLKDNNFNRVIGFEKNKKGDIYTQWKNNTYVVMELINGRESEFNNPLEVALISKTLGEMHLASDGFIVKNQPNRCLYGNAIERYEKKLDEMKFIKTVVLTYENKNTFDKLFLKHVDNFMSDMEKSIQILKGSQYYNLCNEEDKIVICHHDLAYHNILINDDGVNFLDFDYAVLDLRVHDLCNFINKVVKNFAYDFTKAQEIINEYSKVSRLDERELEVLYGMLWFPEGFYSICKDYYSKRKLWTEDSFIYKLVKKLENLEEREEMLLSFKNYYRL